MKNIELLNICYKFFNRFISSSELIDKLESINNKEVNKMVKEIKKIIKNTSYEEDEQIIKEKETIKKLIKRLEDIKEKDNNDFLNEELEKLKKDYDRKRDSYEMWNEICKYITSNDYFNECFDNLSKEELLEFICQYISAPMAPNLSEEEFSDLVNLAIKKDERERLWRLGFNYYRKKFKMEPIIDYFIKVKDGYYISESICAFSDALNIDDIIDKINDKELIEDLIKRKDVIKYYVTEEQFKKLLSKLKK